MRYLTVHDVIWINTAIAGSPQRYDFDRLENAVYSQYSYGDSRDVLAQAGQLLLRLLRDKPFEARSETTALVATMAFLRLNGYALQVRPDEVETTLAQMESGQFCSNEFVRQRTQPTSATSSSLRGVVTEICQQMHLPMKAALAEAH